MAMSFERVLFREVRTPIAISSMLNLGLLAETSLALTSWPTTLVQFKECITIWAPWHTETFQINSHGHKSTDNY